MSNQEVPDQIPDTDPLLIAITAPETSVEKPSQMKCFCFFFAHKWY